MNLSMVLSASGRTGETQKWSGERYAGIIFKKKKIERKPGLVKCGE